MDESKEKSWIKHYWRPVMAYQYTLRASVRPLLTYFFFFMFCGIKIAWEVATTFERNSPFILTLKPELGFTDAQVDDLFQQASEIN